MRSCDVLASVLESALTLAFLNSAYCTTRQHEDKPEMEWVVIHVGSQSRQKSCKAPLMRAHVDKVW